MTLCTRINKIVLLSDFKKLTAKELKAISEHIGECSNCKQKIEQMEEYHKYIQSVKTTVPELRNPDELTNSIIDSIDNLKSSDRGLPKVTKLKLPLNIYKVAAAILLFLFTGFYAQQKIYVSKQLAALEISYAAKNKNKSMIENYYQCKEFSKQYIKQQITSDKKFSGLLSDIFFKKPLLNYDKYASTICLQAHAEFSNADSELKKKIIIEIITADLNQNR